MTLHNGLKIELELPYTHILTCTVCTYPGECSGRSQKKLVTRSEIIGKMTGDAKHTQYVPSM